MVHSEKGSFPHLIDGIRDPKLPFSITMIKKGDQLSLSIATASIIAKVTRDRMMDQLHDEFPNYGWNQNAGYGTKQHQDALFSYGVTCYHRRSYAPIKVLLASERGCLETEEALIRKIT